MIETSNSSALPDFDKPPVVEVVCGVHFKPLKKIISPHIGLLWEKFKSDFPKCREVPLLRSVIERFDGVPQNMFDFEFGGPPPLPRIWFIDETENGIIQIQRDMFMYNWRRVRPKNAYPRYPFVINNFYKLFDSFNSFLAEENLGIIEPVQYEMTYVNHIKQGEGWETLNKIGEVFPDFAWRINEERFLSEPESINWRTSFLLPSKNGRLHLSIQSLIHKDTKRPMLNMELTARGFNNGKGFSTWFDLARKWIVLGFVDLTGANIQKHVWRSAK